MKKTNFEDTAIANKGLEMVERDKQAKEERIKRARENRIEKD